MKKHRQVWTIIISVIICYFATPSIISLSAVDETKITYDEAWNLIKKSYELYASLHISPGSSSWPKGLENQLGYSALKSDGYPFDDRIRIGKYNTVSDISDYSETIFVPQIARYVWSCYENAVWEYDVESGNMVRTKIGDWSLKRDDAGKIIPFENPHLKSTYDLYAGFAMDNNRYCITKTLYNPASFPDNYSEVDLKEISNIGGKALFSMSVCFNDGYSETTYSDPGKVEIAFTKTTDGWRIDDCGHFAALCLDYEHTGIERYFSAGFSGAHINDADPGYFWLNNADKSGMKVQVRYSDNGNTSDPMCFNFLLIENEVNHQHYALNSLEFLNENTGEWERIRIDADFVINNGEWNLVGGELYELLNGKTTVTPYTGPVIMLGPVMLSPATGDVNSHRVYVLLAAAVLSAMICAAAVTVRRRKV